MARAIKVKYNKTNKMDRFLMFLLSRKYYKMVDHYAQKGVIALIDATPKESGQSADSWGYRISIDSERTKIEWTNSNLTSDGTPIVVLLQYGHATRNGGYVEGFDFINPALDSVFKDIADSAWMEATKYR
ncbi:MAG: HK97 gp10 family phage protein [Prevotellaceae bacterium]|nr:HK97 gp10 family phage protein [Candidatus Faecinaster equi]